MAEQSGNVSGCMVLPEPEVQKGGLGDLGVRNAGVFFSHSANVILVNQLPDQSLSFEENIRRIDALLLKITPIPFKILVFNGEVGGDGELTENGSSSNEEGVGIGTLKILLYAVTQGLNVGGTILLFSKHYEMALNNQEEHQNENQINYENIRALNRSPKDLPIRVVCEDLHRSFHRIARYSKL